MLPNDPVMLASYINLKLRDDYSSLEALCDDQDVSMEEIISKLKAAGFKYDSVNRAFR